MAEKVYMPKLFDTMTKGVVLEWKKNVGDQVSSGEVLAEIETDKATMEFESFYDGYLLHIGIEKGKSAPVNAVLAIIGEKGEDVSALVTNAVSPQEDALKEETAIKNEASRFKIRSKKKKKSFIISYFLIFWTFVGLGLYFLYTEFFQEIRPSKEIKLDKISNDNDSNHDDISFLKDCHLPNCDEKEGLEVKWSGGVTDYMVQSEEFLKQIPVNFTGFAKLCDENKLQRYISCKKGKADGITIEYRCEGGYDEQYYKNSIAEGTWILYNNWNQPDFVRNFKNGKLHGEMITYYDKHWAKESEKSFLNGKLHGKSIRYYKSGKIRIYEEYKNGITVFSKSYYEHGQLESEKIYKNGIIDKWIDYDQYGNIIGELKKRDPIIINRP